MKLREIRRDIRRGDDGATLVLALIIITVIAIVMTAVLNQATTSVNSTIALRDQAGSDYAADGAAQAAVNALRKGTFDNATSTQCFGTTGTLPLPNFYPATNGLSGSAASSAAVSCTAESGSGAQGTPVPVSSANKPGQAILTLGKSAAEDGQTWGQSNKPIYVQGAVTSDSTINSNSAALTVTGGVPIQAVGTCSGPITPACTKITTAINDPNYAAPGVTPVVATPPTCKQNKIAIFTPGLYTSSDAFSGCKSSWIWLQPGVYYLDFAAASPVWTISGTVVGGTLTGAQSDTAPAVPGACVNPINSISAVGVELVFGGTSQLSIAKGGAAEFCATYHQNTIPTVLYGLKANLGSGAGLVHAETGCVIAPAGCDLVSDGGNGTKPLFFFEGFVYAPLASIDIAANNTSQPYFNFGLVIRALTFTTTGSACTPPACAPFISLPNDSPGYGTANLIVDLNVYVCIGASTCPTSGPVALTARIAINDPTGTPVAGARQITVLSWSTQH